MAPVDTDNDNRVRAKKNLRIVFLHFDGMDSNPLFQDGDIIYNGLIFREIPEMDTLLPVTYTAAGAGGLAKWSSSMRTPSRTR